MITTDALQEQLNELGRIVAPGECTFRKPVVLEPSTYPKGNGPRGAQVRVWVTRMAGGTDLVRVTIPLHDLSGRFTEEEAASALSRVNRGQPFGSLKVRVVKGQEKSIFRGEVQYAAPITGVDFSWFPEVLNRLLNVWQDATLTVRALAVATRVREEGQSKGETQATANSTSIAPKADARAVKVEPIADLLAELDGLIGMQSVKDAVRRLAATQDIARRRLEIGLRTTAPSAHLVFTGNPGTGKTTVARMIGRLYRSIGLLSSGHVVEVGRSDLVGGYVGQTALKTSKVCESALGGVLFIDEAYSLRSNSGNDFGHEAVETLLTFMEANRGKVAVVVAGYPSEMGSFINMNPGLASRFDLTLGFPDYTNDELAQMLERMFREHDYHVRDSDRARWRWVFSQMPRGRGFGNAREVRRLFHEITGEQAVWLSKKEQFGAHALWRIATPVMSSVSKRYAKPAAKAPEMNLGYL